MNLPLRLRLAVLSALFAGATLATFAALSWWFVRDLRVRQLDSELVAQAERDVARALPPSGWQQAEIVVARNLGARDPRDVLLRVEDESGGLVHRSPHWPSDVTVVWPAAPGSAARRADPKEFPPTREAAPEFRLDPSMRTLPPAVAITGFRSGGLGWRIAVAASAERRVAVAMSLADVDADLAALRNAFLFAVPVAFVLIGLGSWLVASRALRPVRRLNESIRSVTAAGLDHRVSVREQDRDFEELALAFNDMLARLEKSFRQASRFSADAAHELRTPLAILQGQLEREIHQAEPGSRNQQVLSGILDEVHRLSSISAKLLQLSRADASQLKVQRERVDLSGLLEELYDDACMLAPGLEVSHDVAPGIVVQADPGLLAQILRNLLSNAIKYNVDHGRLRIEASSAGANIEVNVSNTSAGIAEEDRARLFERFFRADASHGRRVDGVGLGLSLSRELARAHGGDLTLEVTPDDVVRLRLVLPAGERPARQGAAA